MIEDKLERRLWQKGSSAFWLDPDRWYGVPFGRDGRLEPFWMFLEKRPPPRRGMVHGEISRYAGGDLSLTIDRIGYVCGRPDDLSSLIIRKARELVASSDADAIRDGLSLKELAIKMANLGNDDPLYILYT